MGSVIARHRRCRGNLTKYAFPIDSHGSSASASDPRNDNRLASNFRCLMPNLAQLFIREPGQTRETEIRPRVKTADIKPGEVFNLKRKNDKLQVIDEDGRMIGEVIEEPIKTKTVKILKAKKQVRAIVQFARHGKIKLVLRAEEPLYGNHEIEYKPYLKRDLSAEEEELQLPDMESEDEVVEPEEESPTGDLKIKDISAEETEEESDSETDLEEE